VLLSVKLPSEVAIRVALLGQLRVWRGEVEVDLGPPQQRSVLAALLLRVERLTSMHDLISLLWGLDPPRHAAPTVHKYLGNLRRLFDPALLSRQSGRRLPRRGNGYRAEFSAEELDLLRFRRLTTQARQAVDTGRDDVAVPVFAEALGLWRDRCASDVALRLSASELASAIDDEYLSAVRDAADAALRSGDPRPSLPDLCRATDWAPLNEPLHARLMAALAAAGRWPEALTAFQTIRSNLAGELGLDPGPELREIHERLLRRGNGPTPEPIFLLDRAGFVRARRFWEA
jgi:DNA-binding SARP family transcriptional activator